MTFTFDEVLALLKGLDDAWLYETAQKRKREVYGDVVFLRGIIETSSYCDNDCKYCGLRASNLRSRYRLDADTVTAIARNVADMGISSIVLQGGEDASPQNIAFLDAVIPAIKAIGEVDVTLSHGNFPDEVYKRWKELGADRYLIKMETMRPAYHESLRPGRKYADRLARLKKLLDLGYQVGSGFIAGMPGYTDPMLAQDLLDLSALGVHMFSLSPFISTPGTPWADAPSATPEIVHRACAIYRVLDPRVNIPATSAMNVLRSGIRKDCLARGCNVVMHSFTPRDLRKDYEIYKGKGVVKDEAWGSLSETLEMIEDLGLRVERGEPGRSKKWRNDDERDA